MNRKKQITYLENEIAKQNKTLSELRTAEDRREPDEFYPGHLGPLNDLTQEDIANIVKNL